MVPSDTSSDSSATSTESSTFSEDSEFDIDNESTNEPGCSSGLPEQFLFDNQLYRQIDGVAMGSPLGPLLAGVFMGKLERFQLNNQIKKLKRYGRYVDDIFAIATTETDVAAILNVTNQAHPSIKFTLEMESAG
nr:unnamed protein product [Spirometra erinaceieuropaei]